MTRIDLTGGAIEIAPACSPIEGLGPRLAAAGQVYAPVMGTASLRALLRARLGCAEDRDVTICSGASLGLVSALNVLCQRGDTILIPTCAYPGFAAMARRLDLDVARYDPDRGPGGEAKARCLILNSPHNPTGALASPETLALIFRFCEATGCTLIVDEVYAGLESPRPSIVQAASRFDIRIVEVGSLSKSFAMAGWRIGYVTAPGPLAEAIADAHFALGMSASAPGQVAAEAMLSWPSLPEWQVELRARLAGRRGAAVESLLRAGFAVQAGETPFLWATTGGPALRPGIFPELARRAGVAVADGRAFEGPASMSFRINLAATADDAFGTAIDRLCRLHVAAGKAAA